MPRISIVLAVAIACIALGGTGCRRSRPYAPIAQRYLSCDPPCSPGFACMSPGVCSAVCDPPCSAGWVCRDGACAPLCNPSCAAGYHCAADRTCRAGIAPPRRGGEPTQEWMPAPPTAETGG